MDSNDTPPPELERLARRYRQEQAPAGFTARVMARVERPRPWRWQPAWAYAAALVVAVLVATPFLRDEPRPQALARTGFDTQALASASDWLARNEPAARPLLSDLSGAMSVQSIADLPDPLS